MSIEEILRAGFSAVKSGDRDRAASFFARAVKADPSSVQGWYWLGLCCSAPDRREYCFCRVLALNPNHLEARQQLERLQKPASGIESAPKPSQPITPPVLTSTNHNIPDDKFASPSGAQISSKSPASEKSLSQRKKPKRRPGWLLWSIPLLILCGLAAGTLFFSNRLAGILPGIAEFLTPIPLPTQAVLLPLNPPTASASPTPLPPTAIPTPQPTVSYTPLFENVQCPFDIPANANVTCGYAIVPEDRSGDPSHTIRLAVAIYHSRSKTAAQEPVVFLQGGPGAEALMLSAAAYEILVAPFLSERDFIVFDQRGTGLSEPALKCDELTKAFLDDIHGLTPGTARKLVYSNAIVSCNGLMSVQGVNLNAYTTIASAADAKDILTLLGYQKAVFYGASYGTRLAQVIMRDYPEIVHSAVLDSVVPIETSLFSKFPVGVEHALETLFESCAADPECNAAYPQLEAVFWDLVRQLDAQPVSVTTTFPQTGKITETVTGTTLMSLVLGSIKQSSLISTAPQTIYRFQGGDYSTLMAAQTSLPYIFEGSSPGLYISMMCHEHILATSLEELQTTDVAQQVFKEYVWLPFYGSAEDLVRTCKSWGAIGPWLGENDPVVSDIPVLIISGKFDPVTPPAFGQQITGPLSHSYYFEFPDQGHTPSVADSSGCAMGIVQSFIDDPTVEPDRSCLNEMGAVDFVVPYTGTPAIPLKTVDVGGISVEVPKGWLSFTEGIYFRNNSPLDITQVGIIQANVRSSELEEWFSSIVHGYLGLDSAAIQSGQRRANGEIWSLYTAASDGRPVDIAMAEFGGRTLLVMLFCNPDEHDALYRTVFLPMVDSAQP